MRRCQQYLGPVRLLFVILLLVAGISSAQEELAQFEGPLPKGCNVNEADLVSPAIPAGMTSAIRLVEINNSVRFSLSSGDIAEFLQSTNQVEPNPGGYDWGDGCRGRVRFAFVNDGDESPNGSGNGLQDPAAGPVDQTAAAVVSGGADGTSTTSASIKPGDSQCDPPGSASPRKVLVPDVRFLSQGCIGTSSTSRADAGVATDQSRFSNCEEWGEVTESGFVAKHSAVVGLVLPGGTNIPWSLNIGRGATWVEHDLGPYEGDDSDGPRLKESSFSNGVVISEQEKGVAALVPVSMLPYWSGSEIASPQKVNDGNWPVPSPIFRQNGDTYIDDLYFGSDFKLGKNGAVSGTSDGFSLQVEALARNANGQRIETSDCSEKLVFEISVEFPRKMQGTDPAQEIPLPFFEFEAVDQSYLSGDSIRVILESGATYDLAALLDPYLHKIDEQHYDLFLGATVTMRAWPEGEPAEILGEVDFAVYRLVDASDDEHHGRSVAMARTLGDGPGGVVRKRRVDVSVVESAEFTLEPLDDYGFSFDRAERGKPSFFIFDPKQTDVRVKDQKDVLVLTRQGAVDSTVAVIPITGTAEPKNKILFDFGGFERALAETYDRAITPKYSQNYADYKKLPKTASGLVDYQNTPTVALQAFAEFLKVHPALLTEDERRIISSSSRRSAIAQRIKARMTELWSPFMQAIEWASGEDPDNTVKILWKVRENRFWKAPFAFGVSLNESGGRQGTDSLKEIEALVRTIDQYNDAEAAFRLSRVMNPGLRKDINMFMDSVFERHLGSPSQSISLTEDEFVNGVSKTAVHETGHTFGLSHNSQSAGITKENLGELQLLRIPRNEPGRSISFGADTLAMPMGELQKIDGTPTHFLSARMKLFQSIGVATMEKIADPQTARGLYIIRCDDKSFPWVTANAAGRCLTEDGSRDKELWVALFTNHLLGYDMPEITLSKGSVETLRNGMGFAYIERNVNNYRCKNAIVDEYDEEGPDRQTVLLDIMHGGFNDVSGALSFQPKVSLELTKMALALDYSVDEAKHAIESYIRQIRSFDAYGGTDFKAKTTGSPKLYSVYCGPEYLINAMTGEYFKLP